MRKIISILLCSKAPFLLKEIHIKIFVELKIYFFKDRIWFRFSECEEIFVELKINFSKSILSGSLGPLSSLIFSLVSQWRKSHQIVYRNNKMGWVTTDTFMKRLKTLFSVSKLKNLRIIETDRQYNTILLVI